MLIASLNSNLEKDALQLIATCSLPILSPANVRQPLFAIDFSARFLNLYMRVSRYQDTAWAVLQANYKPESLKWR